MGLGELFYFFYSLVPIFGAAPLYFCRIKGKGGFFLLQFQSKLRSFPKNFITFAVHRLVF